VDWRVRLVGVAGGRGEECGLRGPCRPRGLAELILVWVHGVLIMCAVRRGVCERKAEGMDKESTVVRRVLNGPCAGGHGGQVISEANSHGPKARFKSWEFPKRNGPFQSSHASPTVCWPALTL